MTPRQRLQTVLRGDLPDCVPVSPDISNMVPARLTGKPFWQLYLYNDPPIWEAYIAAAHRLGFDALMDGYFPLTFHDERPADDNPWQPFIVFRADDRIVVQRSRMEGGKRLWQPVVSVFYVADSPTGGVPPEKIGLPREPSRYEPLEGVREVDTGPEGLKRVMALMGDQGLVGVNLASTVAFRNERDIYAYYDHPERHERWAAERIEAVERRFERIASMDVRPDFLCVGGSGTLVFQTVEMFRRVALPAVKRGIELAAAAGIPTHVHSCGPERELVKIMAEETELTVIDPLERPPMGDCNLADLKRHWGSAIVLKGNLHTTDTMLRGTADDVVRASKQAIDDAAGGGRFILSTGDQCGRDTPWENLEAIIETARGYGKY